MKIVRSIIAILLPPLAVFMTMGLSPALVINIGLTVLGWVPGSIHALWVVLKSSDVGDRGEAY